MHTIIRGLATYIESLEHTGRGHAEAIRPTTRDFGCEVGHELDRIQHTFVAEELDLGSLLT